MKMCAFITYIYGGLDFEILHLFLIMVMFMVNKLLKAPELVR